MHLNRTLFCLRQLHSSAWMHMVYGTDVLLLYNDYSDEVKHYIISVMKNSC